MAVLAGAVGWWLGRRPDPRLVAQLAQLTTENAQLDSAVQAYQAEGPAVDTVIVRARAAAAQHDTVTLTLIDSVILAVPDTLQPILERIRAAHIATVASYKTALETAAARLARADSLLARSEQLRKANLALAAAAVKHSSSIGS